MTEEEERQFRMELPHAVVKRGFVLHDGGHTVLTSVPPLSRDQGRTAKTGVVVCGHDEAGVQQGRDHMQIPPGVLPQTVSHLDDGAGCTNRLVDPRLDPVTPIVRRELDLADAHRLLLDAGPTLLCAGLVRTPPPRKVRSPHTAGGRASVVG
jgi:hypothetical protein